MFFVRRGNKNAIILRLLNNFRISTQIMPLGFEFGGRRLKGFFETGYGYQGMFITGARYAF